MLVKFFYNPYSGENKILEYLDYIINAYQRKGFTIVPYRISSSSSIEEGFKNIDDRYHHILISGGDGTVNEVINIMKNLNINLPIGVLPGGTANDFAHLIGMPYDIKYAVKMILSSEPQEIDLGYANDKYFCNIFSSGLFTDVSQKTPTEFKNTFGKLAYYFTGLKELPNFKMLNLSVKSKEFIYEGPSILFFVFNGRTAGNFEIASLSSVNDGLLDVIIIPGNNILEHLTTLPSFLLKKGEPLPKSIIHFKTSELEINITNKNIYTTDIDGEPGPLFPVKIECKKNSLKVLGWV